MIKVLLFLSSYLPLFAVLSLLSGGKNKNMAYVFVMASTLSWVGLELYFWYARARMHSETLHIRSSKLRDAEILSHSVTYLIPSLVVFATPPLDLVALGFFVVIGFLSVNFNMIHINPVLSLRGYHLVDVQLFDGSFHSLLTRKRLRGRAAVDAVAIGEGIYLQQESNALAKSLGPD